MAQVNLEEEEVQKASGQGVVSQNASGGGVIDPDEVAVRLEGQDDEEYLKEVRRTEAENPKSLCVIDSGYDRKKFLGITVRKIETWRPCHGAARNSMTEEQFFTALERKDLWEEQDTRDNVRFGLEIAGFVSTLTAVPLLVLALVYESPELAIGGATLVVGGFGMGIYAHYMPIQITTAQEAYQLSQGFNRTHVAEEVSFRDSKRPLEAGISFQF